MADPGDELERILADARVQLSRIRLDLPDLEGGSPSPRDVKEWARTSLDVAAFVPVKPPAPAPPPEELPSVQPSAAPPDDEPQDAPSPASAAPSPPPAVLAPVPRRTPTPVPVPLSPPAAASATAVTPPWKRLGWPAAGALALALGAGVLLRSGRGSIEVPFEQYDALTIDASGAVIAAHDLRIDRRSGEDLTSRASGLSRPLRSLSWAADGLYGTDGSPTLLRWPSADAPPDRFSLDHEPVAVFAANGSVWTQDAEGNIRQYLLNRSMTGVFLQPLDRAMLPGGRVGPFAVGRDGAVLALDPKGVLLRFEHAQSAFSEPARGRSYGPGAVLVPAPEGARVLVPRDDGAPLLRTL